MQITKKQAIELIGFDEKIFTNYFQMAGEFFPLPRLSNSGRFYFDDEQLKQWKKSYEWRLVTLTREDYNLCLDFALAMHFRGYVLSDWGTARQREFGQKITNWVKGQLAEVAVKKFIKTNFGLDVELDFDLREEIVPQDIVGILKAGKSFTPKINVSIKASKPKSAYLVLGQNEIEMSNRSSDVYIFCRPDLPDDHLLRIAKSEVIDSVSDQPHYNRYHNDIPSFTNIICELAGFCYKEELEKVTSIPGQAFDNGYRYVKQSGKLRKSKEEWVKLIAKMQ